MAATIPAKKLEKLKEIVKIMMTDACNRSPDYEKNAKRIRIEYTYISGRECPVYIKSNYRNTIEYCSQCKHCKFGRKVIKRIVIPEGYLDQSINIKEAAFEEIFGTEAACWIKIEEGRLQWIFMLGYGDRKPWWKPLAKEEKENIAKK